MSTRKDLPPPGSPTFLARVREEIHALLGKTGSARDRALTLADAINSGVIGVGPGGGLIPGPGVGDDYEPDLTPPPTPGSFTASPAISHILIEQEQPAYTQGHGHLRTRVYGATHMEGDPLPVFADAVEVGQFEGTIWALASNPATTWHLWIKWESRDGVLSADPSGGTNGVAATTGQDVSSLLEALSEQISFGQLATDLATPISQIPGIDLTASLALSRADQGLASVDALQAEVTTRASETGNLFAKYTVKVDVAGHVSGYGLASTANNGAVVSQFGIRADQFFIAPPAFSSALDPSSAWGPIDANAVAFNGRFVAGGASGYVATSEDGAVWTVQLGLANTAWGSAAVRAMTSGASVLLAGGDAGRMATSPDGIAWTYQDGLRATTWGTTANCLSIARSGSVFVALGQSGRAATSPDGVTWTYRSGLSATTWGTTTSGNAVLWSGSVFVAGGDAGRVATSPDGVTWTYRGGLRTTTWGTAAAVTALAWNGSVFLAVGASGRAATSPDGITWTYRSGLSATTWGTATANAATWDGSKFIVVGDSGRVATSPDGVTWTYQGQLSSTAWSTGSVRGIAQGSSRLVLVGYNGNAAYSMDGLTWTVGGLSTATPNLVYKGMVWVDTSVTPNVTRYYTGSSWSTTPQALPFVVQTTPTTINGVAVPPGAYFNDAFIQNGTITNAKIANLAVDDAKIANLSVSKLTAGSLAVGQYAQSTGYVAGSSGWRINGDGTAEFSGVVVRGTIFASQGEIGGITIASNAVRAGQSGFNAGQGFYIGSDGTLSIGDSAGERIVWDGSSLEIETADFGLAGGNARFSGDISGATGSFSGTLLAGTIDVTQLVGQTFTYSTPGTHYVVVPESFTRMRVTAVGGGAGGGAGGSGVVGGGGGGGGGGGLSIATFTVSPGSLITVYVGSGGGPGVAGQGSSVYQYISAGYGLPGGNGNSNATAGAGGSGGSGTTAAGNAGAPGTPGYQNYSCSYDQKTGLVDSCVLISQGPGAGGAGGASKFAGYGAGGRGGNGQTGAGRTGGANGFVQIEFFNPNGVIIRSDWDTLQSALLRQGIQVV